MVFTVAFCCVPGACIGQAAGPAGAVAGVVRNVQPRHCSSSLCSGIGGRAAPVYCIYLSRRTLSYLVPAGVLRLFPRENPNIPANILPPVFGGGLISWDCADVSVMGATLPVCGQPLVRHAVYMDYDLGGVRRGRTLAGPQQPLYSIHDKTKLWPLLFSLCSDDLHCVLANNKAGTAIYLELCFRVHSLPDHHSDSLRDYLPDTCGQCVVRPKELPTKSIVFQLHISQKLTTIISQMKYTPGLS